MINIKKPKKTTADQENIVASIDALDEAAAAADGRQEFKRIKQLIDIAGDILDVIAERTRGAREAKFVADFVRASVNYWQPDSKS